MPNTKSPSSSDAAVSGEAQLVSANLRRNFIWNIIGSTTSAFISLFLMMVVTRLNSIDDAGIFSFAFSTAMIFYVIGIYSGRTFQVTDKNHKTTDSDYFSLRFLTCIAMLIFGIIFCLIRGYSGDKLIVIMSLIAFRMLEALSECIYAVIQKQNRLYQVGQSMFIKAVFSLVGFTVIDYFTRNITLSCTVIILANLLTIIFFDLPRLAKTGFHFEKFRSAKVWYLLKIGFFTFGFSLLNLYIINAARYALDSSASDSAQTIYGIVAMPATVLTLVGQYLIQPFLTNFKKFFATDTHAFQWLTIKLCLALFGVGVVCLLAAWLLGLPVLELLYAIELDGNLTSLLLIIVGGIFSALVLVISTALVTMRRTSSQFWIYCIASVIALFVSRYLVFNGGVFGACLSYMLSMILLFAMYVGVFCYHLRKLKLNPTQEVQHAVRE